MFFFFFLADETIYLLNGNKSILFIYLLLNQKSKRFCFFYHKTNGSCVTKDVKKNQISNDIPSSRIYIRSFCTCGIKKKGTQRLICREDKPIIVIFISNDAFFFLKKKKIFIQRHSIGLHVDLLSIIVCFSTLSRFH
jgi:hypothetical protein